MSDDFDPRAWYCVKCGEETGSHGHGVGTCKPNPEKWALREEQIKRFEERRRSKP